MFIFTYTSLKEWTSLYLIPAWNILLLALSVCLIICSSMVHGLAQDVSVAEIDYYYANSEITKSLEPVDDLHAPYIASSRFIFNLPEGKVPFDLVTDRLIIGMNASLTLSQKAAILSHEKRLKPVGREHDLLQRGILRVELSQPLNEKALQQLILDLQAIQEVSWANPVLRYKDGTLQGLTNRVVVELKTLNDYNKLLQLTQTHQINPPISSNLNEKTFFLDLDKNAALSASAFVQKMSQTEVFSYIEPDFLLFLNPNGNTPKGDRSAQMMTNDPLYSNQWHLENTGQTFGLVTSTVDSDIDANLAWPTATGNGIKVAILDDGVAAHSDLNGNIQNGYDVSGAFPPAPTPGIPFSWDSHGTACAGLVGSIKNTIGGVGVAYNCEIIPVRVAYHASSTATTWTTSNTILASGINTARINGADILSCSWGGGSSSSSINSAISSAVSLGRNGKGCVILFASGNDNSPILSYPASNSNVIAVGAMSMCNQRKNPFSCDGESWWGSNYGSGLNVVAPGVLMTTTDNPGLAGSSSTDYTSFFNGTSAACPTAAGVVALILSTNSTLTTVQAQNILEQTCAKVGAYTYTQTTGLPNGTWSTSMGYGCVNAAAAVQAAQPLPDLTFKPQTSSLSINGTSVQITAGIENIGSSTAGSCKLMYFVWDTTPGGLGVIFIDSTTISPLAAGASQTYTSSNVDVSTLITTPGNYIPGFGVDWYDVVPEVNDSVSSNVGVWYSSPVIIPAGPPAPIASFGTSTSAVCAGGQITFSNTSANATSYQWNFGGGASSSTLASPTITFNTPGTYTVTLTATNSSGSDMASMTISVFAYPNITISGPTSLCSNASPVTLIASPSGGTFSGTGVNSSGVFDPSVGVGTYMITYSVTQNGCNSNAPHVISVTSCNIAPTAMFTANQTTAGVNAPIDFDASASTGTITSYRWHFPGSNTPNPASSTSPLYGSVIYPQAGIYDVSLIASGPAGSDTLLQSMYISIHPFQLAPTNAFASMLGTAQIEGLPADQADWIAAFDSQGQCVGANQLTINSNNSYFNLSIFGNDPTTPMIDEGMDPGENFTLKLWDASTNELLDYPNSSAPQQFSGWTNTFGFPIAAYSNFNDIYNFLQVSIDTLILRAGWNLVSTDLAPTDSSMAHISNQLGNNLVYVTGFENGPLTYNPNGPIFLNTLTHLKRGLGYWIRVISTDTLVLEGELLPSSPKPGLNSGWNLSAYIPEEAQTPATYFNSLINSNNLVYVTGFDNGPKTFNPNGPAFLNSLDSLQNGFGYWVRVFNPVSGGNYRNGLTPYGQTMNPSFDFFNGQMNIAGRSIDGTVEIRNQSGKLVGEMNILQEGYLMTTAVFGDDPTTEEIEGLAPGEVLSFYFNGLKATEEVIFYGQMRLETLRLNFPNQIALLVSPNPFYQHLHISFNLPETNTTNLAIYDIQGREVQVLHQAEMEAGFHKHVWNASAYASGIYLVRLEIDGKLIQSRKVILR